MLLDKFKRAKQTEIEELQKQVQEGREFSYYQGQRPSLAKALTEKGPGAIIAEYKRASPSKGAINLRLSPEEVAEVYKKGGAAAISVLTEKEYFQGQLDYLQQMHGQGLPLLRKDFLFHPLQVKATATTPAAALLLIVRMFKSEEEKSLLGELLDLSTELGLEAVLEIFDADDLQVAREIGARIIQVNNRDLDTLKVDLQTSRRLIAAKASQEVWICASGINSGQDVLEMAGLGYNACLVGTSLMSNSDPQAMLSSLVKKERA